MSKKKIDYRPAVYNPNVRKKLVYSDPYRHYREYSFDLGKRGTGLGSAVYNFVIRCRGTDFSDVYREMESSNGLTVAKSIVDHYSDFTIQDDDGSVIYR